MMKLPKNVPAPMFIRPNDYVTIAGSDYIIKRNEFQQMVKVVGRVSRKLPSEKDIVWALKEYRPVAYWGNKYFLYERIDPDQLPEINAMIWEADKRRGIEPPDLKDAGDALYDF